MRRLRWGALIAVSVLGAGCHTYVPTTNPQPGTTVRVRVPVTSALDNGNAAPAVASIEGEVIESGDSLLLATSQRQEYGAYREITMVDTLRLGPDQLLSLEQAEFSTGRTVVLTAAVVGAAVGIGLAAFRGGGSTMPGGDPPPPQGAIVISNSFLSGVLGLLGFSR